MIGKRLLLPALIALTAACSDSNTQPSSAANNTLNFTAQLMPSNEVPAVSNAEASGQGTVWITVALTRDAGGAITAATATFNVSLSGFPSGTRLTGAHIHEAPAGTNAGVRVNTGLASGEVTLADGSGGFTKSVTAAVDVIQRMSDNPAGFYFNVHSTTNPGGVARGQLVKN